jgi:hypothetical protein
MVDMGTAARGVWWLAAAPVTGDAGSDECVHGGEERVAEVVEMWVVLGGGSEQGNEWRWPKLEPASMTDGSRARERDGRGYGFYGTGGHDARSSGSK